MKKLITSITLGLLLATTAHADTDLQQRAAESKTAVKEFMTQLQTELQTAMKSGGPVNAIKVCNEKAPEIARSLSEKYGWKIARTSLKNRNSSNAPDTWETSALNTFEKRKADGEAVEPMAFFEAVDDNGKKSFRFMKAIPTGEVCLKCHGENIAPEIKAKLEKTYPDDKATGFKLGDIRGAFTITQPM